MTLFLLQLVLVEQPQLIPELVTIVSLSSGISGSTIQGAGGNDLFSISDCITSDSLMGGAGNDGFNFFASKSQLQLSTLAWVKIPFLVVTSEIVSLSLLPHYPVVLKLITLSSTTVQSGSGADYRVANVVSSALFSTDTGADSIYFAKSVKDTVGGSINMTLSVWWCC